MSLQQHDNCTHNVKADPKHGGFTCSMYTLIIYMAVRIRVDAHRTDENGVDLSSHD